MHKHKLQHYVYVKPVLEVQFSRCRGGGPVPTLQLGIVLKNQELTSSAWLLVSIEPAYPYHFLVDPARPGIPDCEAQLAFLGLWPEV